MGTGLGCGNLSFVVGNGRRVKFWKDIWFGDEPWVDLWDQTSEGVIETSVNHL